MPKNSGDKQAAEIYKLIYTDKIQHVKIGTRWFKSWCEHFELETKATWTSLVNTYFNGFIKPPFSHQARNSAGMTQDWYEGVCI